MAPFVLNLVASLAPQLFSLWHSLNEMLKCPTAGVDVLEKGKNLCPNRESKHSLISIATTPLRLRVTRSLKQLSTGTVVCDRRKQHTIHQTKELGTCNLEKPLKHNLTNLLTDNKSTVRYCKQHETLKAQVELQSHNHCVRCKINNFEVIWCLYNRPSHTQQDRK